MKVLLIEYEPRYVDRIRAFLATGEREVVVARDGDEGLEAYRRSRPDLVLISSVLPRLRTPDVIKSMQALGPTPPILLMMSGYKGRNKRADAQRVGATSILEKPFGEEVFLAEVAAALGEAPSLDVAGSATTRPGVDVSEPLLSAEDIFSDIVSGIEGTPPAPAPPSADSESRGGRSDPPRSPSRRRSPRRSASLPGGSRQSPNPVPRPDPSRSHRSPSDARTRSTRSRWTSMISSRRRRCPPLGRPRNRPKSRPRSRQKSRG